MKGAVSAQKALQKSHTETRELMVGTEEKSISPDEGSIISPAGKNQCFLHKKETEIKVELVARPSSGAVETSYSIGVD